MNKIQLILTMCVFSTCTWFIEGIVIHFIHVNNGIPLTRNAVRVWRGSFLLFALLIFSQQVSPSFSLYLSLFLLLCWGYMLTLFDSSNHWLPREYTLGFWLSGLLLTLLDGNLSQLLHPIIISLGACLILLSIRTISGYLTKNQALGLGDVLLVAGYFSWFYWQGAAQLAGAAFLALALGGRCLNRHRMPYAPFLFMTTLLALSALPNNVHSLLQE